MEITRAGAAPYTLLPAQHLYRVTKLVDHRGGHPLRPGAAISTRFSTAAKTASEVGLTFVENADDAMDLACRVDSAQAQLLGLWPIRAVEPRHRDRKQAQRPRTSSDRTVETAR